MTITPVIISAKVSPTTDTICGMASRRPTCSTACVRVMPQDIAISMYPEEANSPNADRVYRIRPAPTMMPTLKAGSINEVSARPGAPQPAAGKPCEGRTPIRPTPRPNSRISSMPLHSAGMAPPTMETSR